MLNPSLEKTKAKRKCSVSWAKNMSVASSAEGVRPSHKEFPGT